MYLPISFKNKEKRYLYLFPSRTLAFILDLISTNYPEHRLKLQSLSLCKTVGSVFLEYIHKYYDYLRVYPTRSPCCEYFMRQKYIPHPAKVILDPAEGIDSPSRNPPQVR